MRRLKIERDKLCYGTVPKVCPTKTDDFQKPWKIFYFQCHLGLRSPLLSKSDILYEQPVSLKISYFIAIHSPTDQFSCAPTTKIMSSNAMSLSIQPCPLFSTFFTLMRKPLIAHIQIVKRFRNVKSCF